MSENNYEIRTMSRQEVDIAVEWAAGEGWNPGLHDADCFHAADPGGFLVGLLDDQPIGCISAVRYGEGFGFLGFYIVKPQFRGRGYGIQLWRAAMEAMDGRNVGLDGVVAQQDNYRKSGFKLAYRNIRYEGRGTGTRSLAPGLVPLSQVPLAEVQAYDEPLFPASRSGFVQCWINQPDNTALGIADGDRLAGYGMLRPCRAGFKIGPLFADDPDRAKALFDSLVAHAPAGAPVFFDPPEVNAAAVALAEANDMEVVFETARMYTGEPPAIALEKVFGVTTFELG